MTEKDPAGLWKVAACTFFVLAIAAFLNGVHGHGLESSMERLGGFIGGMLGSAIVIAAPGILFALFLKGFRAKAFLAASGVAAAILVVGAVEISTPGFQAAVRRLDSQSSASSRQVAGPWTQYAKAPAATTSKSANYFDRFDKPAPAPPAAANDGLPAGYKLIEPASAPSALDPAAAFELAATQFLVANCEFRFESNRLILQQRINEIASAQPAIRDDDLLLAAAQAARASEGFRPGVGCG